MGNIRIKRLHPRPIILFILLIGIVGALKAFGQNDPVRYFIQTNQSAKAKSFLLKELNANTISPDRIYLLGRLYVTEKNIDSANLAFNKLKPEVEEQRLLSLIGKSSSDIIPVKKADLSAKMQREMRSLSNSKSALVKLEAAFILAQIGMQEEAWELIDQACNLIPVSAETFVAAGDVYVRLNEVMNDNALYGKACGRYEQALLVNDKYLPAMTALAKANLQSRNFPEAKRKLVSALAVDSLWIPGLKLMGELQYDLGNYSLASNYYTKYINSIIPSRLQLQKYAYILYFNQEHDKAQNIITDLLVDEPNNSVLLRLLAYTSCELKQASEGLMAMDKFMKIRQQSDDSMKILSSDYEYYGRLLSMQGNDSLAVIQYSKALEFDSISITTYEYLAKSYEKLKNFERAINTLDIVTANNPDSPASLWFSKGRDCMLMAETPVIANDSLMKTMVLKKAVESFAKVTETSPNSHLGFFWKARAQASLDPESVKGLAHESYSKSIEILEAKNQIDKYKVEMIEAYSYMGYLYYLKYEPAMKINNEEALSFKSVSIGYWNKILELDSSNTVALQAVKALK